MKSFSLSSTFQKIMCIVIDVFFIIFHVMVFVGAEASITILILFFFFTLILCIFYTMIVFFSVIIVDEAKEILIYKIIKSSYFDLRDVRAVKLEKRPNGKTEKEVIVLYNHRGFTMGEINPFLTKRSLQIMPKIYEEINRVINP